METLWEVANANNAGIFSRTAPILERMMAIIVAACREVGLTVPDAKTGTTCLRPEKYRAVEFDVHATDKIDKKMSIPTGVHL